MKSLQIEVPATSANLGPGFDTLGLALEIADTVHVEFEVENKDVVLTEVTGNDLDLDPRDNLLCRAYRLWGEGLSVELPGAQFKVESRIPVAKGLGSSAASIVAGLTAAQRALGTIDAVDRLIQLAAKLEGHADNVAAAAMGGLTTAFRDGDTVEALHIANHLALGVALFVPHQGLGTQEARAALPQSVPLTNAVFNVGRVAYLTTALVWGRWERIGPAMQDRLHQPYRSRLIPALGDVINAALAAGAYGAALSGGGPSVVALGPQEEAEQFGIAMEQAAREGDWEGQCVLTQVRRAGVQVKEVY